MSDAPRRYLVWSFEHGGWWTPGGARGYTNELEEAGLFSHDRALEICLSGNIVGINEAMVPLGEHTLDGERKRERPVGQASAEAVAGADLIVANPEALSRAAQVVNLWLAGTATPEDFLRPAQRIALIAEIAEALDR